MRRLWLFIFALTLFAEPDVHPGVVRGRITHISNSAISLTTSSGDPVECAMDTRTYMERDGQRIFAGALRAEDPVELIVDRKAGSCYTRTVRVITAGFKLASLRPVRSLDYIFPRGNLTFSGVVRRVNANVLVLRTREEPEKMVLLRDDTRFLESGFPADRTHLLVNTRVFVRGGKNIENDLEAYQIIWGEIAGPKAAADR